MADVGYGGNRSRGQLIIVTGLLVAVSLVAITLLLNTAIYSENLASRGSDIGGNDALEFKSVTEETIGELIDKENSREHTSYTDVTDNVSASVAEFNETITHRHALKGRSADVSNVSLDQGAFLRQSNASRNMTNASWNTDWSLVKGVSDARSFAVTISDGLNDTDTPEDESFTVIVNDSSDNEWIVYFYNDSNTPTLAVKNESVGSPTELDCGFDINVTVDLTRGEVGGEPCGGLVFGEDVSSSSYDIRFEEGHEAKGTYELTVNESGSVVSQNFNGAGGDSPRNLNAVYSVRYDIAFENPYLRYESSVRVARGEPP